MTILLIFIIFITGFFGNLFVDYRILPPSVTLITELSVYLLFCISFIQRTFRSLDLVLIYILFTLIAVISAFINNHLDLSLLVGLRFVLRFYLFYLALINLDLEEKQFKWINALLYTLFVIQIPAVAFRFSYLGISEKTIGTYAGHGGGLTPIIPIVAIGYLSGFYILTKKHWIYPLLIVSFVLLGIAGEKRVLFFLYPIFFFGIYYLGYVKGQKVSFIKLAAIALVMIAAMVSVQILMMKNIRTLNPEQTYGEGTVDYSHVMDYAKRYETSERYGHKGSGAGRISTTLVAIETLFGADVEQIFFGFGPGTVVSSIMNSGSKLDHRLFAFNNSYGKTGFAYIMIEYGLFGVILISSVFIIFLFRSYHWFNMEPDPHMKALALGTVVFTFLQTWVYFMYNRVPVADDTIVPVYFYAMAFMFVRMKQLDHLNASKLSQAGL